VTGGEPNDDRWLAVDAAYRAHADDVYRVSYAVLRDVEAAMDITQDTFARAYEAWHRYDPTRPLVPWLQSIAVRAALDQVRRRRVRELAVPLLGRLSLSPGSRDYAGTDLAAGVVDRHRLDQELARMRPQMRAALVLRHVYGYQNQEIAVMLGTAPGTVGSLLHRAHASLRSRLDPVIGGGAAPTSAEEWT
jgi:RNA polymerase sigma-70 factor (ECF subfamily)